MRLADGLRRHGFQTWYERELLQSHAHLALAFVCAVGVLAVFSPQDGGRGAVGTVQALATLMLCGGVGVWSLRRYLFLLSHAEATAQQAACPDCGTYARFRLVRELVAGPEDGEAVQVCCRRCGRQWEIAG